MSAQYDVVVIGAGPAGLTAALYASRARLATLVIDKEKLGGQLVDLQTIENYPGCADGILGPDLASQMVMQVSNLGTRIELDEVEALGVDGQTKVVRCSRNEFTAKAVVIAGGSSHRKLGVPGEEEFAGRGVFYCATCDGPGFANQVVAVAGGGNSGVTEALQMAQYVSQVVLIEIMPQLNAEKILKDRLMAHPKIQVRCGTRIESIRGDSRVKALDLATVATGDKSTLEVGGVLIRVGVLPATEYLKGKLELDKFGQVMVDSELATSVPGVFAAGDVRHGSSLQIATAVGDGALAAISAGRYLSKL